jgi:hypothetical protein
MMVLGLSLAMYTATWADAPASAPIPVAVATAEPAPAATLLPPVVITPEAAAQEALEPPKWLEKAVSHAMTLPIVGPVLVEIMKWLGMIAAVMTALATAFMAVAKALSAVLKGMKLIELAVKVEALYTRVAPWLQFLSMYNVQKKPEKSA